MPNVTAAQMARIAAALGHRNLRVDPSGAAAWRCSCSCGYESTNKRTPALAAGSAVHHLELIVAEWQRSGASLRSLHLVEN
jgi:hypothetical protein